MSDYPELSDYSWKDCHKGFIGAGGLFLVSEMAQKMELKKGMRVLDLCCGNCSGSIFLAKHYGVNVVAADLEINPSENWKRIRDAGLTETIIPMKMDARNILLPEEYFDAVFCLNSYFYFGTDDLYLPYLTRFIRPLGKIGIVSPCYADELTPDIIRQSFSDFKEKEYYVMHSPKWWQKHFETMGLVNILSCEKHSMGREFWLDEIRWLLEECHPRDRDSWMREMIFQDILMLLTDQQRLLTYFMLLVEKC
jgi:cyclopropane fatty-acyl-phospholipid synthase-like methyltransferase